MKSDLDSLMAAHNLDAILVTGPAQHNPAMVYLTGGGHLTQADLVKARGQEAVLFHGPMERDEAAHSGLKTICYTKYSWPDLMKQAGGDRLLASALRYKCMLQDAGVNAGALALYGQVDLGWGSAVMGALQHIAPDLTLVGFQPNDVLQQAMSTKDAAEIERIGRVARATVEVVGRTAEFLSSQTARSGVLCDRDGQPLTIGQVKSRMRLWCAELGIENPEDIIFSIARDAGIPHSIGGPSDILRLGQTIVFDIFPCEIGGGYFYDMTRTWCLGYAPDPAARLYEQVRQVYQQVVSELRPGEPFNHYQKRTCTLFEAQGHPTIASNPAIEEGYVHNVGHGVGLHIHELPASSSTAPENNLTPGMVFTIEPGLYYPERGLGVRLEDTFWMTSQGEVKQFAEYPLDLILPVKE